MKNNTFRRLLAMAAAGAMLTSIAACGSSSNDDTASNGSDSTVRGDTLGDFEMLLAFCIEAHQTFEQVSNNFAAAHFIGVAWN